MNRIEDELRASQALLESVTENLQEAIYRSSAQHDLIFVNGAYLRLFGYRSLEELQSMPRERLYADPDARGRVLRRLARDGAFQNEEIAFIRRDGSRFWGLMNSRAIRAEDGRVLYHVGSILDISDRRAAEQRIRELNQTLEARIEERTAALRISNDRLRDEIVERERREKVEHALFRITEAIHQAEDLNDLFPLIHAAVQELMPARNFYIALHEPVSGFLKLPYWRDEHDPAPAYLQPSVGLTGQVFRSGESLLVERHRDGLPERGGDTVVRERLALDLERGVGTPAMVWLGVPLKLRGQTIGVMAVQEYRDPVAYTEKEQRMLTFIAGQAALAIERKRAEDEFRQRHRELTTLLDSLPGEAFFKDIAGRYRLANRHFCDAVGVPADRLIGLTDFEVFPAAVAERLREADLRLLAAGSPEQFDEIRPVPDGSVRHTQVVRVPLQDADGAVVGLIGLGFDITERMRAEEELRRALAREQELGQMKSNFTSLVSHEFRTPLGIIASSAEILRDYFDRLEPGERREHLSTIHKHTVRMGNLMEEVLLLSRFDAGRTEFRPEEIDLGRFARRIAEDVEAGSGSRCPIAVDLPADLPAGVADERLLRHVLTNLLANAVKYSDPGSAVSLGITRSGADVVLEVRDRGIGIPEDDLPGLFEAFHRGSNVGHRPGTGLGLVVVKRCLDLHRGRITVESTVGRGTTIRVFVPVFDPETEPCA